MLIFIITLWLLIGLITYIYWERQESAITIKTLLWPGLPVICCGPIAFIAAWIVLAKKPLISRILNKTIIKKKK